MKKILFAIVIAIALSFFLGCAGMRVILDNDDPDRKALKGEAQDMRWNWYKEMHR